MLCATSAEGQVRDTARTRRDTVRGPGDTAVVRRDTTKRDTTGAVRVPVPPAEDSLAQRAERTLESKPVPKDTIKAPLITAPAPVLADPNGSFVWDRRDMFSTGALTVQDLLDRIPGVTALRAGWISQPIISSFMGDPGRVRVFLDGLELTEMDPRMGRIWDLTQVPLWALDDIRVERAASEIRIHMRSWRVDRTTPFTRTDVYTGDQGTNLYRGLFGRRYGHGEILQVAGQQYATDPGRSIESSDQLSALARVGIARPRWSADAFMLRTGRHRGRTFTEPVSDTVPSVESTRTDAYARVGYGTPDRGLWAQALAMASKYSYGGEPVSATLSEESDTLRFEGQYLATGGYTFGPWRATLSQRYRTSAQRRTWSPSMRLGFESKQLSASVNAEGRWVDSTRRVDASVVVRPLDFVFIGGAFGVEQPLGDSVPGATSPRSASFSRVEAGVRVLNGLWLSGGLMRRDSVVLDAPTIYRKETPLVADDAQTATFAAIRGRLWKAVYADIQGIQWSDTGSFYRPRYQARSELYLSTQMLDRFPTGNFHVLASVAHEYRSHILWPDASGTPIREKGYRMISTLLQFRIVSAEIFWNFRNVLGERYSQVPGYRQPRISNIYGVRWEFWN